MNQQCIFFSLVIFFLASGPFVANAITVEITATVPGCGDGVIGVGEQCDGSNLGGASCTSQGFTGGSLSCTSACTFSTLQCTNSSGGGSGSGRIGGGVSFPPSIPTTNVVFIGKAYPKSTVTLLKDAQVVATTIADTNANFQMTLSNLSGGNYIFSVYSENSNGIRSSLLTFPIKVTSGVTTKVGDIFITPTIATDKNEVHKNVVAELSKENVMSGDITGDSYVNLVDFSIVAYWYKRANPPVSVDLNADGKVDLIDFSIMAFNWTG